MRIRLSDVGILGDVRFQKDLITSDDGFLEFYLNTTEIDGFLLSRGKRYYSELTCNDLIVDIKKYHLRYKSTNCLYYKYILIDHTLNGMVRLLDILVSYNEAKLINYYIDKIKQLSVLIINFFMGKELFSLSDYSMDFPKYLGLKKTRIYLEGDNHLLSLLSVMQMPASDVCVGVLFGGAVSASIYSAYHHSQLNYVKLSCYDDVSFNSENLWGAEINNNTSVLILDDNCGTGKTLKLAQQILKNNYHINAKIAAIELHWEKLLRIKGYRHQDVIFDVNSLDYLTPLSVRHHHLLNQLVTNNEQIKMHRTSVNEWIEYSQVILSLLADLGEVAPDLEQLKNAWD
ncbi:phosphoribosyltransferase [Aliivibrio sp. S10_S31]|uniref:phosphoribosyltransferase n=1 Tax=Aliivibrio sp. S10_S31 TaxID=2720224 RepID=UPI001681BF79|nr:phosphoribosyltransferase [Aliivibrio sp. S10_S31]MBD1570308.1 phosphoribosyltransferase [Aliivibrio sp. S10_S31]